MRALTWLAIPILLLIAAVLALIFLATDSRALVERSEVISPNSTVHAKQIFLANDPRRQRSGEIRTAAIPSTLIDEGVNYVAGRYLHGRGAFVLGENAGEIRFTIALPARRFVNLRTQVNIVDGKPDIDNASLGSLPVPAALVKFAMEKAVTAYGFGKEWALAAQAIQSVSATPSSGIVAITYIWQPTILERARAAAIQEDDVQRLRSAQTSLAALVAHRAPGTALPLSEVIHGTFSDSGDDPVKSGRAVLLVLASHLAGKDLAALVPAARSWPRIRWVNMTLAGRHDLAQHFVVSAALAAWAGEPVADAIGLYKELEDARDGSGFSFIDLSADRAGTRFGETLIAHAEPLLTTIRNGLVDAQLLPPVADLPESLHGAEFTNRFGNHQSAAFKAMQQEIERRLDTLPIYR